jgi:hypothetical protein
VAGFYPGDVFRPKGYLSGETTDSATMNSPYFIFLIRVDHVLGLAVHLAAGILALMLLTGAAGAGNHAATATTTPPAVVAGR